MAFEDYATYREIVTQAQAWAQALELARGVSLGELTEDPDEVIFAGCGSTYYLSMAAAVLCEELTGRRARATSAGELLLNPRTVLTGRRTRLVAVSRSGTTSETVKVAETFKNEARGDVIVISNNAERLSEYGDATIIITRGQEESVAQTRSFSSMYVAAAALCARIAGRTDLLDAMEGLPKAGDRLIARYGAQARELGENLSYDRFYFLGSGTRHGLACEASLKMKEMSLTHSEAFHFLEFRHGPMSMAGPGTCILGLLSESSARHEKAVLAEMQALGARTTSLAESGDGVAFDSGIPEAARGVLYLPFLQLVAFHRSLAKGLNPDRPKNLTGVVKLDL